MAPKYKLVYFNARGRAEICRLLFAAAGVDYEDERIEFKDWPEMKKQMPQGVVPILLIDNEVTVCQSMAIARYLAREFNLYGKSSRETLYIDQFLDTAIDIAKEYAETVFSEPDAAKKQEKLTKFQTETLPKILGFLENLVNSFGNDGFAVGNSYTLADLYLLAVVEFAGAAEAVEKFPKLSAVLQKVKEHPGIAKHIQVRPQTSF